MDGINGLTILYSLSFLISFLLINNYFIGFTDNNLLSVLLVCNLIIKILYLVIYGLVLLYLLVYGLVIACNNRKIVFITITTTTEAPTTTEGRRFGFRIIR